MQVATLPASAQHSGLRALAERETTAGQQQVSRMRAAAEQARSCPEEARSDLLRTSMDLQQQTGALLRSVDLSRTFHHPRVRVLSVSLSLCLYVCLSVCLSLFLSVFLPLSLSICLSPFLSVCLSLCHAGSLYAQFHGHVRLCVHVFVFVCVSGSNGKADGRISR
jgi:hypothetical protein